MTIPGYYPVILEGFSGCCQEIILESSKTALQKAWYLWVGADSRTPSPLFFYLLNDNISPDIESTCYKF